MTTAMTTTNSKPAMTARPPPQAIQMGARGITLTTFDEVQRFCGAMVQAGHFDVKDVAQAIVRVQYGAELGMPPVTAMQNIFITREGKMGVAAAFKASRVNASGRYRYRVAEWTENTCRLEWSELCDGKWEKIGPSEMTWAEATTAGVTGKANWRWRKSMLFARALTQGCNAYCPDVFMGVTVDEYDDSFDETPPPTDDVPRVASQRLRSWADEESIAATVIDETRDIAPPVEDEPAAYETEEPLHVQEAEEEAPHEAPPDDSPEVVERAKAHLDQSLLIATLLDIERAEEPSTLASIVAPAQTKLRQAQYQIARALAADKHRRLTGKTSTRVAAGTAELVDKARVIMATATK